MNLEMSKFRVQMSKKITRLSDLSPQAVLLNPELQATLALRKIRNFQLGSSRGFLLMSRQLCDTNFFNPIIPQGNIHTTPHSNLSVSIRCFRSLTLRVVKLNQLSFKIVLLLFSLASSTTFLPCRPHFPSCFESQICCFSAL